MRLAAAGMGGCLADDMGLGKTIQTLAHVLAEKQAGNRIGRLTRPDRAREERWNHGSGGQAVISDDAPGLMDDYDGGEALLCRGELGLLQLDRQLVVRA